MTDGVNAAHLDNVAKSKSVVEQTGVNITNLLYIDVVEYRTAFKLFKVRSPSRVVRN